MCYLTLTSPTSSAAPCWCSPGMGTATPATCDTAAWVTAASLFPGVGDGDGIRGGLELPHTHGYPLLSPNSRKPQCVFHRRHHHYSVAPHCRHHRGSLVVEAQVRALAVGSELLRPSSMAHSGILLQETCWVWKEFPDIPHLMPTLRQALTPCSISKPAAPMVVRKQCHTSRGQSRPQRSMERGPSDVPDPKPRPPGLREFVAL